MFVAAAVTVEEVTGKRNAEGGKLQILFLAGLPGMVGVVRPQSQTMGMHY